MRSVLILAVLVSLAAPAAAEPTVEQTIAEHSVLADRARKLARQHFDALAGGELEELKRLWSPKAKVTSHAGEKTTVTSIGRAARRWIGSREGMIWNITGAGVLADGTIWVTAHVNWNKSEFRDTLFVERHESGFRLVAKTSDAIVASSGGY